MKDHLYKIIIWTSSLRRSVRVGIFFAIIFPVFILGIINYNRTKRDMSEYALAGRQAIAQFGALSVHEKLNQLKEVGILLATRVQFRTLVSNGEWGHAINIMSDVSKNFSMVDRIFLTDSEGNLKADLPSHPNLIGTNFKYRDWYKGAMEAKAPYVSNVYKRMAEPRYNVISVTVPVMNEKNKIVALLGLQVINDKIFSSINKIKMGPAANIYIIDKEGNVAAHSRFSSLNEILNYSILPVVKKVLLGKNGVEIDYNAIEKQKSITAFEPVPEYGWGVIAEQPVVAAFSLQSSNLKGLMLINGAILIFTVVLAFFILWIILLVKKGEAKLLKSQMFVDSVLENIPDMIMVKEINEFRFVRINKAGEDLIGYSRKDLVGKNYYSIFPKEEAELFMERDRDVVFKRKKVEIPEEKFHTRFKGERLLHTKKIPIFDDHFQVEYLLAISEDITEKKVIEETERKLVQEREARKLAERSIIIRDDFLAIASHELKTPITALKLDLQFLVKLLSRGGSKEKIEEIARASLKSIDLLTSLVNVLLDVTVIQSGHIELHREVVSLSDIVLNVCSRFDIQLQQANCSPLFDLDQTIVGRWDKLRLEQIISNIIINAIKYAPNVPLKIKVSGDKEVAIVSIQDFGQGIAEDFKNKLFKRFERGVTHEHISGFGLGLFIAEQLVKAHQGRIQLKSKIGEGTTFIIELPRNLEGK